MKTRSLKDLGELADVLARQRSQREAETRAAQIREAQVRRDRDSFALAVGSVQPLRSNPPAAPFRSAVAPLARMRQRDEEAVLRDSISDDFTPTTLLETDDQLSFVAEGVAASVLRQLRNGHWTVQGQIDLHGHRTEQARAALSEFLRRAQKDQLRCLRVIHGKGHGSPGKTAVLKSRVASWLAQKQEVLAFVQARPADGGAGALLVLLKGTKPRNRG